MSTKIKAGTATTGAVVDADATGILELQTGSTPTTALTIDASRNVGIGTTTPSTYSGQLSIASGSVAGFPSYSTGGLSGIGAATFRAYQNSSGGFIRYLDIVSFGDGVGAVGSNIRFLTQGTGETPLECVRIDSSGNLLVGRTGPSANDNTAGFYVTPLGAAAIQRSGATSLYLNRFTSDGSVAEFRRQGTTVGSVSVTAAATAYNTSSDYRLKENIAPMTGALATVQALKPVTYNWKIDGSSGQGFIAHELQAVVPDCVTGEKDAVDEEGNPQYQGIDTSFLVATLTKAIQELKAELDTVKAEVAELKGVA